MPALDVELEEEAPESQDDLRPGDLRRMANRAVGAAERVATSEALGRLLKQLQPERRGSGDSLSSGKVLADVMSGVSGALKGMGDAYKGMFENLTALAKPTQGQDSGATLAVGLLAAVMPMFLQMMEQSNQRWQAVVEGRDKTYGEIIADLRRTIGERSGASPYDQIAHGMVQQLFQQQMQEMTRPRRSFIEEIAETAETVATARKHLEALGGGASPVEYSDGALRHMELSTRREEITGKQRIELEKAKANRAAWLAIGRAGPGMVGELLSRGMAAFGIGVPQIGAMDGTE